MIDFQGPFQEGLNAYHDTVRAKAEIERVIREFSDQLKAASEGAILEVRVAVHEDVVREEGSWLGVGLRVKYESLVAFAKATADDPEPSRSLCKFRMSAHGYPVGLVYADIDVQCHDRTSLEQSLADLLKHPDTGAKLAQLMSTASVPATPNSPTE